MVPAPSTAEMTSSGGLFIATYGHGPPVVTVHGGLGWDHTYLRPGLDCLAARVRLIYFDLLGHGRSAVPEESTLLDHGQWVESIEKVRRHIGAEQIVLFGHSYGGFLAQEYALEHGDRLAGLILCSTAPVLDHGDAAVREVLERATPEQAQALAQGVAGPVGTDEELGRIVRTVLPLYFHRPDEELISTAFSSVVWRAEPYNRGFFHCLPLFNTLPRLGELRVPTLLLGGRHDWITPPAPGVERLHQGIVGSDLHIFERSGHFPFLEEPEEFCEVVSNWLVANGVAESSRAV